MFQNYYDLSHYNSSMLRNFKVLHNELKCNAKWNQYVYIYIYIYIYIYSYISIKRKKKDETSKNEKFVSTSLSNGLSSGEERREFCN